MPRDVACDICGGRFFPSSLPFHRKACAKTFMERSAAGHFDRPALTGMEFGEQQENIAPGGVRGGGSTFANKSTSRSSAASRPVVQPGSAGGGRANHSNSARQYEELSNSFRSGYANHGGGRSSASSSSSRAEGGPSTSRKFIDAQQPQPTSMMYKMNAAMGMGGSGPEQAQLGGLVPCRVCGRTFAPDRIGKHEQICAKTSKKKRRVYNTAAHRVATDGTDIGSGFGFGMPPPIRKKGRQPTSGSASASTSRCSRSEPLVRSDWRAKSLAFRQAIRNARQLGPMHGGGSSMMGGGGIMGGGSRNMMGRGASSGSRGGGTFGGRGGPGPGIQQTRSRGSMPARGQGFQHQERPLGSSSSSSSQVNKRNSRGDARRFTSGVGSSSRSGAAVRRDGGPPTSGGRRATDLAGGSTTRRTTRANYPPSGGGGFGDPPPAWGRQMAGGFGGGGGMNLLNSNKTSADNPMVMGVR
ncbi:unnamed protein product [Amoebophrya sp. A25]|nr:unnamed protein product [Amoebophrya sp. A25]|eukprot:GSA25T00023821001.1